MTATSLKWGAETLVNKQREGKKVNSQDEFGFYSQRLVESTKLGLALEQKVKVHLIT